jgi:hypothetical protein
VAQNERRAGRNRGRFHAQTHDRAGAQRQGARSYELLASLALAKLYQSTDRTADAHAVLTPALEGFSPTPEMPEIAEAQTLLESLARGGEEAILRKAKRQRVDGGWPRL